MSNVQATDENPSLLSKLKATANEYFQPKTDSPIVISTKYKEDPTKKMKATEWHGTQDIRVIERPAPAITDASDAIIRITSATVCGSDLHMSVHTQLHLTVHQNYASIDSRSHTTLCCTCFRSVRYFNKVPAPRGAGMQTGDVLGHEAMGVVDSVGPGVSRLKVGDRVVISAPISCGQCEYCLDERYSQCDRTNPSATTEYLYGHRTSALFGYSHLTGGVAGSQADYCRVPFADVNCLPVPAHLSDEQVLLLSDVMTTVRYTECEYNAPRLL